MAARGEAPTNTTRESGEGVPVSETVYKLLELTGTSTVSMEDAVHTAVARAAKTIRNMHWFQVIETRGSIKDGKVSQWQVTLKIGFGLDEPSA